jgi:predicted phosphodiesterase
MGDRVKYLVVSDLHTGAKGVCDFGNNGNKFIKWASSFGNIGHDIILVLGGDIKDLWQGKEEKIDENHEKLFLWLKIKKAIWIRGNHDYTLTGKSKIRITLNDGRKVLITHGHQSDDRMRNPFIRFGVWCLGWLERIGLKNIDNPEKSMLLGKQYRKAVRRVKNWAYRQFNKYDIVIVGHSHCKEIEKGLTSLEKTVKSTVFVNTGSCMHGRFEGAIIDIGKSTVELV